MGGFHVIRYYPYTHTMCTYPRPACVVRLRFFHALFFAAAMSFFAIAASGQRQMENLGRGVVAVRSSVTTVFVSWRLLGYEPQVLPFNVYRSENGGTAQKLNTTPLSAGTNFEDSTANVAVPNAYFVRPVVNGVELTASANYVLPANAPIRPYLSMPLRATPWSTYVHLVWVGDLDGDGEYDFVVSRLPLEGGRTQFIDAYKRDGTFLWRVDFGPSSVDPDNIEPAAAAICAGHNDGVTVYDLDCDGRAEVIIKSANGVVFGDGQTLTYGDNVTQFISVLDGLTGAERARAPVPTDYIADGPVAGHFGIAYLDGVKPSFIFKAKNRVGNGGFNLFITAWDFHDQTLVQRWKWLRGNQDAPDDHQIRIVDVDRDGRDEICDGGYVLDDNGTMLYSLGPQGVVHGDRFHIGDLDPDRPGLEGFGIQQNNSSGLLYYIYDAATGEMLRKHFGGIEDTARGTAADIAPAHRGYEYWSFHGIHDIKTGSVISPDPQRPWPNFRIWWDGNVLSENLNREIVEKWVPATGAVNRLLTATSDGAVDSWRDAAQFYGDILGDWREEIVFEKSDHTALLIYTTPIPTDVRLYTLPHNPEYRACFTVKGYLQSNMIDYYLGEGMTPPPLPNITPVIGANASIPAIISFASDSGVANDRITNDSTPTLQGIAPPNAQIIISRLGGDDDGIAVADASGNWSFGYNNAIADGEHFFLARVNDGQNNYSFPFNVTISTAAPASPTIDAVILNGTGGLVVQGTSSPNLQVTVSISSIGQIGSATVDATGSWSVNYTGVIPPNFSYTVSAIAIDVAGNESLSVQRVVDLSIASPTITSITEDTGISNSDGVTSDRNIQFTGTAAAGVQVQLHRLGVGVIGLATADAGGIWTYTYGDTLADGVYAFTALSGQSVGAPAFSARIDGAAPVIISFNRVAPAAASSSETTVVYRLTFDEDVFGLDTSDFTLVFTGTLSGTISGVTSAGPSTYDVIVSPLAGEGTVRLDLNASRTGVVDRAGNSLVGGFTGPIFTRVLFGNGVWTSTTSGGYWSANGNWLGGIVADGSGTTADFSTIELPEDITVHLDAPRTVANIIFGDEDITSAASWNIDSNGNPANTLTLANGSAVPSITVGTLGVGAQTIVGASLAGTNGLNKAGAGTLMLTGQNTLTGAVSVNAGALSVGAGGKLTPGTVNISANGAFLSVAGGEVVSSGTANVNNGSNLIVDSGSASFSSIVASNNTGNAVRVNGGTLVANSVTFLRSTDGNLNYNTGLIVKGGSAQLGTIALGTNNSNAMMSVEGGAVTATGAIVLGNQSSGGRGGHLRVTGGSFDSTDGSATGGLIITRRNNNSSSANFLGGVSMIEKITLGFDASVTGGSGMLNLNGGTLHLGAGGITKNAGGTFAANINLTSGVLGAKSDWSTALPINLPSGGNIVIKTANQNDEPRDIVFGGILSGVGNITKIGAGTLTMSGVNTSTGSINIEEGTLRVSGSLADGGSVNVNDGGTLAGSGPIAKPIVLNDGGAIAPDGNAPITTLAASSMIWNAGGKLAIDLGANGVSDQLTLTELNKGSDGVHAIALRASEPIARGYQYTIATFGSTTFTQNELSTTGLPDGFAGYPLIDSSGIRIVIVARPLITSATSVASVFGAPFTYTITADNEPTSFSASGLPPGLTLDTATGVISGAIGAAGTFNITLGATNYAGTGSSSLTLTVAKAIAPVIFGKPEKSTITRNYDGTPKQASVTTEPAELNATFTYNGSTTPPTLPGTYDVVATIDDPNYEGTAAGKLVIATAILVRHAPVLNGEIEGSVQILSPEYIILNGGAMISGDLLVLGTPRVVQLGRPIYGGTIDANGSTSPGWHMIVLSGNALLRHVVRRVDPIEMPTVEVPPQPVGVRRVWLNHPNQDPGDFATLRDLTLNGNVGGVSIPPGTYGHFTANGTNRFVLGMEGATEPTTYNLQSLTLNGGMIEIVGPVVLTVAYGPQLNGTARSTTGSGKLILRVARGGLTLNGNGQLSAEVVAPNGWVIINGGAKLEGRVTSDWLVINGRGLLQEPPEE